MYRPLTLMVLLALLGACANTGAPIAQPLTEGSRIRVRQAFAELPNGSYLDFQNGIRVAQGNLDRWTTWCRLYVYDHTRGADHRISLIPGDFTAGAVRMGYRSSDFPDWGILGVGFFPRGVHELPSYYLYGVRMPLSSPRQPELRSLECYKKWATPNANQYPTLAEMRAALGGFVEIELAPSPAESN